MVARNPRWRCVDCGQDTIAIGHYYMVYDYIWELCGVAPNEGMLCVHCLEARLGRPLVLEDFTTIVPRAWKQMRPRG
jgi:hypothetical protein